MNEGIIALLTAIFTTIGVKVVERVLPSTDKKLDDATQIRQELRKEVQDLRDNLDKVETREEDLRSKIRTSEDNNFKLQRENDLLKEQNTKLVSDLAEAKKREESQKEEIYRANQQIESMYKTIATYKMGNP